MVVFFELSVDKLMLWFGVSRILVETLGAKRNYQA
jgi:hypothetical protein